MPYCSRNYLISSRLLKKVSDIIVLLLVSAVCKREKERDMSRKAGMERKTGETDIRMEFELDGKGAYDIETGIGFLNHMLELFARHGRFNLNIRASGDLQVDAHHTSEDTGIVLGKLIREALGDKVSVKRYGTAFVPMDETLAMVSLDLSGRPFLVFGTGDLPEGRSRGKSGGKAGDASGDRITGKASEFDLDLVEEFLRAVAFNAGITMHIKVLYGKNLHHIAEAIFKAFARALREASMIDPEIDGVLSTKGIL